jgi:hypothetical protein
MSVRRRNANGEADLRTLVHHTTAPIGAATTRGSMMPTKFEPAYADMIEAARDRLEAERTVDQRLWCSRGETSGTNFASTTATQRTFDWIENLLIKGSNVMSEPDTPAQLLDALNKPQIEAGSDWHLSRSEYEHYCNGFIAAAADFYYAVVEDILEYPDGKQANAQGPSEGPAVLTTPTKPQADDDHGPDVRGGDARGDDSEIECVWVYRLAAMEGGFVIASDLGDAAGSLLSCLHDDLLDVCDLEMRCDTGDCTRHSRDWVLLVDHLPGRSARPTPLSKNPPF